MTDCRMDMQEDDAAKLFTWLIAQCPSLASFNRFIVPCMKVETKKLREIAATEARKRGYKADKELGLYVTEAL